MIYKLLRAEEWARLQAARSFAGSAVDLADGFVHFSTAAQVRETAAKHFAGVRGLVLAEVDPERLRGPLKWEPSRGGALFPHLYAELPLAAVTRRWTLAPGPDGRHEFPSEIPSDQ
ncbi:MAG: hypothetical protein FD126_3650 [Elusimicrobia bacterium]|nr:MAG: hypothetical protein FD126_3650 [Elusimicrobiota bacterium]